jgi:pyrroloquinoline quinone (PQQ) biosynthesis protein C
MIADALRVEIEAYAGRARQSSPLFTRARDGSLTPAHLTRYLANVHQLILYTPVCLLRAEERSRALGRHELAEHFREKRGEEVGHERWAEADLSRLSPRLTKPIPRDVAPALKELIQSVLRWIDEDPSLYLAYILFAEQTTVSIGPDWLRLLEENCGIPRAAMSVVGNHVELDVDHVEAGLGSIDDLVPEPTMLPRLRAVLLGSMTLFDQFCSQILALADHDLAAAPAA